MPTFVRPEFCRQPRQIGEMSVGGASYRSGVVRLSRPLPDMRGRPKPVSSFWRSEGGKSFTHSGALQPYDRPRNPIPSSPASVIQSPSWSGRPRARGFALAQSMKSLRHWGRSPATAADVLQSDDPPHIGARSYLWIRKLSPQIPQQPILAAQEARRRKPSGPPRPPGAS